MGGGVDRVERTGTDGGGKIDEPEGRDEKGEEWRGGTTTRVGR